MYAVYALAYTLLNFCMPGVHKFRSSQNNFSSKMLCKMVLMALIFDPDLPLLFKLHKFGQLILGKIIKIVATRCQILRLKCTKFDFG